MMRMVHYLQLKMEGCNGRVIDMRWRQCLLDANVLVLYVAGRVDKGLIGSHRRLREYVEADFDVLMLVLGQSGQVATTVNVLTEVSNLLENKAAAGPNRLLVELHRVVLETRELVVASADACAVDGFTRVGLSDAGLLSLAAPDSPVITSDRELYERICRNNPDAAFNFWNLSNQYQVSRRIFLND